MNKTFFIKILLAIFLGVLAGLFIPSDFSLLGISLLEIYHLLGQLFLRALTLMVIPLVAASIITGAMRLGGDKAIGKIGSKILFCFICTMACAVAIGIAAVLWMKPGVGQFFGESAVQASQAMASSSAEPLSTAARLEQILFKMIPDNVLAAASQGEILGIILFTALFGVFSAELGGTTLEALKNFWESTFKVLIRMTQWVMYFLPLGVFGLIAKASATLGLSAVKTLSSFVLTVSIALFIYAFVLWPLALWIIARVDPWKHVKAMGPALLTAFTTSSSAASLPIALECVEKRSGVSNRVSSLVLPLGIAMNLSASALYAAAVVTFIAQLTGAPLDIGSVVFMFAVSLLTCFGMAGIPSASLVATLLILQTLNIPNEHLAFIMAIERFVDMARTAINLFGISCCAVLVARLEGEQTSIALGGNNG